MKENKVCLGAIVGVHGIRGEVKIKSFSDDEKHLTAYGALSNADNTQKLELKLVGHSKDLLRAKIKGVEDRTTAEKYVGTGLYIERDKLPALAEEEYYHADLIGLEVKNSSHKVLGKVNAMYNFGAGDILEVKTNEGNLEMLPFNKNFVPTINIKDGYIIVEMMFEASDAEEEV